MSIFLLSWWLIMFLLLYLQLSAGKNKQQYKTIHKNTTSYFIGSRHWWKVTKHMYSSTILRYLHSICETWLVGGDARSNRLFALSQNLCTVVWVFLVKVQFNGLSVYSGRTHAVIWPLLCCLLYGHRWINICCGLTKKMLHLLHQQTGLAYKISCLHKQGGLGCSQIPSLNYCFSPPWFYFLPIGSHCSYILLPWKHITLQEEKKSRSLDI